MAETMVLQGSTGNGIDGGGIDGGAGAVVHGMLATLAEVLDRLEGRLSALEATVARPDTSALEARIDRVVTAVTNSLADAIAGEVRAALQAARADAAEGVSRLADLLADRALPLPAPEPAQAAGPTLGAFGILLDERLAGVTAGIADLLADDNGDAATLRALARNLARVEAELAEARAESAMAAQAVAERVERVVADALARPEPEPVPETDPAAGEEILRRTMGAVEAMVANAERIEAAAAVTARPEPDGSVARLADRVAQLQEAVNRSRGETVSAVDRLAAELDARLTALAGEDRLRPLLAALENSSREHQEGLATLHTAVVRRIDGRTSALARVLDGVGEVGPVLQRLTATAETVERGIAGLRDDLAQEVAVLAKRQTAAGRLLERVGAAVEEEQRRLDSVQATCQSLAEAVGRQEGSDSRVADLVLDLRSAVRGDLERLESTVALDGAKSRQHEQARLAQMAAGVTEVVERETALVAQRVAGLGTALESLRRALHAQAGPA